MPKPRRCRSRARTTEEGEAVRIEDVKTIGVCGAGTMGAGIAQQASVSGYTVRVLDVDDAAWARGLAIITASLDRMLAKEKITQVDKDAILGRISYSTDASAFADVDYVIEAVFEDLEVCLLYTSDA